MLMIREAVAGLRATVAERAPTEAEILPVLEWCQRVWNREVPLRAEDLPAVLDIAAIAMADYGLLFREQLLERLGLEAFAEHLADIGEELASMPWDEVRAELVALPPSPLADRLASRIRERLGLNRDPEQQGASRLSPSTPGVEGGGREVPPTEPSGGGSVMDPQHLPPPSPPPQEYWDASEWLHEHYHEVLRDCPNQWVAVIDGRVATSGALSHVQEFVQRELTGRHPYVFLVERSPGAYANRA